MSHISASNSQVLVKTTMSEAASHARRIQRVRSACNRFHIAHLPAHWLGLAESRRLVARMIGELSVTPSKLPKREETLGRQA